MKIFKNPKKLCISNTIRNFKNKITFKKGLKETLKGILVGFSTYTIIGWLMFLVLGATSTIPLILASAIYFGLFGGYFFGILNLYEVLEQHIKNKQASKEIDSIVETMNQNDIDLTKEEINDKVDVCEIENNKGFEYLDNGEYKKRKRVINYITINNNDKYKIIKEVTTYIRNVFYKKYSSNTYIMNEQDLVTEGFIDEKGKVTEKGKLLNLKMN